MVLREVSRFINNPRRYRYWWFLIDIPLRRRIGASLIWILRRPWLYSQTHLAMVEESLRLERKRRKEFETALMTIHQEINGDEPFYSWQRVYQDIRERNQAKWN